MQYWSEAQFEQLQGRAAGQALQQGAAAVAAAGVPAQDLAGSVAQSARSSRKRLMDEPRIDASEKALDRMLLTLADRRLRHARSAAPAAARSKASRWTRPSRSTRPSSRTPTPKLDKLLVFRSIHPLYGGFPARPARHRRPRRAPAGAGERAGGAAAAAAVRARAVAGRAAARPAGDDAARPRADPARPDRRPAAAEPEDDEEDDDWEREEERPPTLAEKLRLLFDATYPDVADVHTQSVWAAGELLRYGGNFNLYVQVRDLVKQEGIIFRHLLRLILLLRRVRPGLPRGHDAGSLAGRPARPGRSADRELPRGRSGQHR